MNTNTKMQGNKGVMGRVTFAQVRRYAVFQCSLFFFFAGTACAKYDIAVWPNPGYINTASVCIAKGGTWEDRCLFDNGMTACVAVKEVHNEAHILTDQELREVTRYEPNGGACYGYYLPSNQETIVFYNLPTIIRCSPGSPRNTDWVGYSPNSGATPEQILQCTAEDPPKNKGDSCPSSPDPINPGNGNKWKNETDYSSATGGVRFERTYNLIEPIATGNLGYGWTHSYARAVRAPVSGTRATLSRADGKEFVFNFSATNSVWLTDADINERLIELKDGAGARTGWRYATESDETETYDASGRLLSIAARNGQTQTLTYSTASTPTTVAPTAGLLIEVTDSFGRSLKFTYDSASRIATVTGANNEVYSYAYATYTYLSVTYHRLSSVTLPSGGVKTYLYEGSNSGIHALTGILDENTNRVLTWTYDVNGRATGSKRGGNVASYSINRTVDPSSNTISAIVTDPLGTARTYNFQTILGVVKTTGVDQPCPSCGGSQSQATTYDANGNVASRTDFNGKKMCHAYDLARNLETARVEGLASSADCATELAKSITAFTAADQKKVQTLWHATYRLPTKITEPAATSTVGGVPGTKVTDFTYDASGNLLTRVVTAPRNDGTANNDVRTWTYTYNALGQVLTAKDPDNRTTTTVYYAATDTAVPPKYTKGDVQTMTNAAGHVVTMNEYDKNGRVTKMTDANGLITTMTYHPRGWMTSRAVSNSTATETTFYVYDNVGQLTRVVLPDQSNLYYAYDDAHRLVGTSDQLINASPASNGALIVKLVNLSGNKMIYTLDNMGNRIKEQHYDPSGVLQKQKQRAIDALNRLKQDIGGAAYATAAPAGAPSLDPSVANAPANASISQYGYDNNGNVTATTDPLGRITQNQYDALNRLTQVIDPQNGSTKPTIYTYDAQNNLTQVTDPQGLQTKYTYNGHGNLIKQESPDTGTTQTKVNAMGNVVAKIDSVNRCTTTAYDTLHRPTTIKFYASSNTSTNTQAFCFGTIAGTVAVEETHTYTYDSITASLGGPGGKGRLSRIADAAGRVDYVYDLFGRITSKTNVLTGATNPNRVVTYAYNTNGQLRSTTYPSGNTIAYTYGSPSSINPGKILGIQLNPTGYTNTTNGGSTPTGGVNLIANSDYKPFGPNWGWDWGNSCDTNNLATCTTSSTPRINQHLRQFDLDYRPITIASDPEGYSRNISWDRANRIASINVPSGITIPGLSNSQSVNQAFGYDALDRLTNFTPGVTGATTLATGLALLPKEDFTYDAIGNRLTRATQAPNATTTNTANYAYPNLTTTSGTKRHILNSIAGANAWTYAYDASGNTTAEGSNVASAATTQFTMTYDAKNRLNKTQIGSNTADFVTYKINAMGQRVQKTGAGTYAFNAATASSFAFNARYVYDESGNLIGEYAPDGKLLTETVWFNGMPIASLRPKGSNSGTPLGISGTTTGNPINGATAANANNAGNNTATNRVNVEVFYIHSDHLGTPRVVTRSTVATGANAPSSANATSPGAINKAVWMWNSDPFGTTGTTGAGGSTNSAPNKNPQNITGTAAQIAAGTFEQNLRMPGQVEDQETKKFYNWNRTYANDVGRYDSSDPIGLKAGVNTFGYVRANPVKRKDKRGLIDSPEEPPPPQFNDECIGLSPYECYVKSVCTVFAVKGGGYGADNREDAIRHCIWNCCLTKMLGAPTAERITNGHEERYVGPPPSNAMDYCNNKHGRDCGKSWLNNTCHNCCEKAPLMNSPGEKCSEGPCK
jgi:RHS repeat-associated protein